MPNNEIQPFRDPSGGEIERSSDSSSDDMQRADESREQAGAPARQEEEERALAQQPERGEEGIERAEENPDELAQPNPEETQEIVLPPEMTEQERIDWVGKITQETRAREQDRLEQKYGKNFIGKARIWLNETKAGRATKIIGKIALGAAAIAGSAVIPGAAGLILAPAVYTLGLKSSIDGAIEAVQHYCLNRGIRAEMQGAKDDLYSMIKGRIGDLQKERDEGRIDEATFAQRLSGIVKEVADQEKKAIEGEGKLANREKTQAAFRSKVSTYSSIAISVLTGVPMGMQNFDAEKAQHAVRFGFKGFQFLQQGAANIFNPQHVVFYKNAALIGAKIGGQQVVNAGATALGYLGVGTAMAGLFGATAYELKKAKEEGRISSEDPKYLSEVEEYKNRVGPNQPTPGPYGPTGEGSQPPEESQAEQPNETPSGVSVRATEAIERREENVITPERELKAEEAMEYLSNIQGRIVRLILEIKYLSENDGALSLIEAKKRQIEALDEAASQTLDGFGVKMDDEVYQKWQAVERDRLMWEMIIETYENNPPQTDGQKARFEEAKKKKDDFDTQSEEAVPAVIELLKKKKAEGGGQEMAEAA